MSIGFRRFGTGCAPQFAPVRDRLGRSGETTLAQASRTTLRGMSVGGLLRGRCACSVVAFEVSDAFAVAYNCHCSNCRATTGSAFLPWGEIEPEKLRVTKGADSLILIGDADGHHATRCGKCLSLLYLGRARAGQRLSGRQSRKRRYPRQRTQPVTAPPRRIASRWYGDSCSG